MDTNTTYELAQIKIQTHVHLVRDILVERSWRGRTNLLDNIKIARSLRLPNTLAEDVAVAMVTELRYHHA